MTISLASTPARTRRAEHSLVRSIRQFTGSRYRGITPPARYHPRFWRLLVRVGRKLAMRAHGVGLHESPPFRLIVAHQCLESQRLQRLAEQVPLILIAGEIAQKLELLHRL